MVAWYYDGGAGLLLADQALAQFVRVRGLLVDPKAPPRHVRDAMSLLRTDLKIELGVRSPADTAQAAWDRGIGPLRGHVCGPGNVDACMAIPHSKETPQVPGGSGELRAARSVAGAPWVRLTTG